MEGQVFFTTVAGLALTIAGFAALISALRGSAANWDPINLWRVKAIVRESFILLFLALALVPIFSLTNDTRVTTRFGAAGIMAWVAIEAFIHRRPDPEIWQPRATWTFYMFGNAMYFALQGVNLQLASVGLLQVGFLLGLASPAGIFTNFVRELGGNAGSDAESVERSRPH